MRKGRFSLHRKSHRVDVLRQRHVFNHAGVLVADPPWSFNDKLDKDGLIRGATSFYSCMTVKDIMNYPIPPMQQDSWLFLWRVSAMVEEAYKVVRAWGFVPKTEMVWRKKTVNGKRHFGMGRYTRAEHESCIIAVRGSPKPLSHSIRSVFSAPVGPHSAKPERFYDIVESLASGPYTELFARRHREGWLCIGDEL